MGEIFTITIDPSASVLKCRYCSRILFIFLLDPSKKITIKKLTHHKCQEMKAYKLEDKST